MFPSPPGTRESAIERAAQGIYYTWLEQQATRMGVQKSRETWDEYAFAVPVSARRIREQAEAALRAVGFR